MRVTLITPTLNAAPFLPEMLASVSAQQWADVEHLAIDGGSTDQTLDLLHADPRVTVVSDPGLGLYAALNRGVALATGDVIGFVNADDVLAGEALVTLMTALKDDPGSSIASGGGLVFASDPDGTTRVVARMNGSGVKRLREQDVTHGVPMLNARLYRRSLLDAIGPFDTRWPRCPDHELLLRLVDARPRTTAVDDVVYHYRAHAQSLTFRGGIERELVEEILAMCRVRLAETVTDPGLNRRFRHWHTWGRAYLAMSDARDRDLRGALRELGRGLATDPLLPLVVPIQIAQHLRMRAQR